MPAAKRGLHAVKAGETKRRPGRPKRKPTLAEAIASGDERAILVANRELVGKMMADPEIKGPAMAALSRQLHLISKEIAAVDREARAEQESSGDGSSADEAWDQSAI